MANREELAVIRGARAGRAESQLALGRLYLFGSAGLPRSLPTALHWLDRAAQQQCAEAWHLIGSHIPFELAQQSTRPLLHWYERAYDGGLVRAGLVLAQLVLALPPGNARAALDAKAAGALEAAAQAGFPEAQWLLARQQAAAPAHGAGASLALGPSARPAGHGWLRCAADNGVSEARFALLDQAWDARQFPAYLERALPLARALVHGAACQTRAGARLAPHEVTLLSRCARALAGSTPPLASATELLRFWELAAAEHDRHAQLALGLWYARMEVDGKRVAEPGAGSASFKKAIRWLTLAGEQGLAEAWYALSRIYIKPEFSQRNVADAQRHLERAAAMGYRAAQLECGSHAWRARREIEGNDVRAVYWLQKAAAQGCPEAASALRRIAPRLAPQFAELAALSGARDFSGSHPLLAARLELAALFNLSRAEALLLDVKAADRGHCLVVDIRASYGRSKRRLVLVETAAERQALDRIVPLFDAIDCGPSGPEGNYRQRLYRLRTLAGEAEAPGAYSLAA